MWAFQFYSLQMFRKAQVWAAWPCNSHRANAGNFSFLPLEQAQLLSWRSLRPFPDIVYGKSSGGCEPTLLAICTVYLPVPHAILTFSTENYEKKRGFTVSLLMSPVSRVFSVRCDKSVLKGLSSMWLVTSLACVSSPHLSFPLYMCSALRLQGILGWNIYVGAESDPHFTCRVWLAAVLPLKMSSMITIKITAFHQCFDN